MDAHRYDDILHLPHHRSATRAHLSGLDRAAQFAPFAALTGFGSAVRETARLTDCRPEPDDSQIEALNQRLQILSEHLEDCPEINVTYFRPDAKKAGGAILTAADRIVKIDLYHREILLGKGLLIPMDALLHLESPLFAPLEDAIP